MAPAEFHTPPEAAAEPVVVASGVTKRYSDHEVLRGIDLQVPQGTIFGFIGPSGSGKTTTIRLLTGVERPTSGILEVIGRNPYQFRAKDRRRIGYLPQVSVLFPSLTLRQNLGFAASIYGIGWPRRKRVRAMLELVGLWDDRKTRLGQASSGMQRRLGLAAALLHEPDLLFLDEPTAGVDPVLRRTLWQQFRTLRDQGRTLFVTTQYVGEAADCDLVAVMRDGRVLVVDSPEGLRQRAFGGDLVEVVTEQELRYDTVHELGLVDEVVSIDKVSDDRQRVRLVVPDAEQAIPEVQRWFQRRSLDVRSVEMHEPSFDEVFVNLVEPEE